MRSATLHHLSFLGESAAFSLFYLLLPNSNPLSLVTNRTKKQRKVIKEGGRKAMHWFAHVYGGRKQAPVTLVQNSLTLLHNSERYQLNKQMREHRGVATDNQNVITAYSCLVDGSFKIPDQGGAAYVLEHDYILVQYGIKYYSAFSPFHMEEAALMGMRAAVTSGIDSCTFLTDSEQLVHVLNTKQTPVNENLRVCTEIKRISSILSQNSCYKCVHIQREENKLAHA